MNTLRKLIPQYIFSAYHLFLAWLGAVWYRHPTRQLRVVGVTGTKGKTTVVEILNTIFENAGYRTAIISSLRFKIGTDSQLNRTGVTMPGRFFMQKLLRRAVDAGCEYAFIEVTSQGIVQHRHRHVAFDAAILLNITPEHIEAHGSFEKYRNAKLGLFLSLEKSGKKNPMAILNQDDESFLYFRSAIQKCGIYAFTKQDVTDYGNTENGIIFFYKGYKVRTGIGGRFNVENILAAMACARVFKISSEVVVDALEKFKGVPGRFEILQKYPFAVIIDYAHTPASLQAIYQSVRELRAEGALGITADYTAQGTRLICVLGGTGGGRDQWKLPVMGEIASNYCDEVILTTEDPYDDDPQKLIEKMKKGFNLNVIGTVDIEELTDRKRAIEIAIEHAQTGDAVIITGKGSEPWMFVAHGKKIPWSDKEIAQRAIANKNNDSGYKNTA